MTCQMLERVVVQGYKSFREVDFPLGRINVLIGANGSGKSNFVQIFQMMNQMANERFQVYVYQAGGADQLLYYGREVTKKMHMEFWFRVDDQRASGYAATWFPTDVNALVFEKEVCYFHDRAQHESPYPEVIVLSPHVESFLPSLSRLNKVAFDVLKAMQSWQVYHFYGTGDSAKVKQTGDLHNNPLLRPDASNLADYLFLLQETAPDAYRNIVETVRMVVPFFDDFVLRPSPLNPDKIQMEWRRQGSDTLLGPHDLSDGTLRFICLTTLFLQPPDRLPAIIILDEPELGLHPYAITLLAEMVHSAAEHAQVILATQSVTLVNQFSPEEVVVVDRVDRASVPRRLSSGEIAPWLDKYGLGDLWEKNLLGGRPAR
jgi:predicted ATPase